jgi:hypothetical protein
MIYTASRLVKSQPVTESFTSPSSTLFQTFFHPQTGDRVFNDSLIAIFIPGRQITVRKQKMICNACGCAWDLPWIEHNGLIWIG